MRARLRFSKFGKVRWTSHRDVARMWERAFRRADLSVARTRGFAPRPRMSFGLALPTGHESEAEYLDVELAAEELSSSEVGELPARLTPMLPAGIDVTAAGAVDGDAGSLQQEVTSCTWRLEVGGTDPARLTDLAREAFDADTLVVSRERKGRQRHDDIRPALHRLVVVGHTETPTELECELATQPRGVRPAELVGGIAPELELSRARRTHQWIERAGARWEPLPLDATDARHAGWRAS